MKLENRVTFADREESVAELNARINDQTLKVLGFYGNTKASEKYVVVEVQENHDCMQWSIPYQYRRTSVFIEDSKSLLRYLSEKKPYLTEKGVSDFVKCTKKQIKKVFGDKAKITIPIFRKLLNACGKWIQNNSFNNENPQRRIQTIKEKGFTLATKFEDGNTFHMLLPFPRSEAFTYETISSNVRKHIIKVLDGIDAFNGKESDSSCLPDHKFPEIRWDKEVPQDNSNLTDDQIREKFQLIPERINQTKREVCRKCFQSGIRGKVNGIKFFFEGNEIWDETIPRVGREAERGCRGCFWHDMNKWRDALHLKLGGNRE